MWRLRVSSARLERNHPSCEQDRRFSLMQFSIICVTSRLGCIPALCWGIFVRHSTRETGFSEHGQSVHAAGYSNIVDMRWKINPRPTAWCRNRIQELNGSEEDTCSTSRRLTETSDFGVIWPYRGMSCTWWKRLYELTKPGYASIPALAGLALHHAVDLGLNLRIGSTFLNANRHSYSITCVKRYYVSRMSDKQKDLKTLRALRKACYSPRVPYKIPQWSTGMYPSRDVVPISMCSLLVLRSFTLSEPVYWRATYILRIRKCFDFCSLPIQRVCNELSSNVVKDFPHKIL